MSALEELLAQPQRFSRQLTTDHDNHLLYHAESVGDGASDVRTLTLDGTWRLRADHELVFVVKDAQGHSRNTLRLKGALVSATADQLVFALEQDEGDDESRSQITLLGRWQADERNRLTFLVRKAKGHEDRLVLQSGWQVGPHHELLYRYTTRQGARRREAEHTVAFEGAWDITEADRLVYRLSGSSDSAFEFTASLQSPSLMARDGAIVYQVGIRLSRTQTLRQRVTLFGSWKLNKDLSVAFEIPYAEGRVQAIQFEGRLALSPRDQVAVALSNGDREGLGLTVIFTREVMKDAQLFLQLSKQAQEFSALAGVRVQF